MTLDEFGATIKQKYPQYSNIDNVRLGRLVLQKYPQYRSVLTSEPDPSRLTPTEKAGEEATQFLSKSPLQQIFTKRFAKEFAKTLHQNVRGVATPVAQFVTSAIKAPIDVWNYFKQGGSRDYYKNLASQQFGGTFLTNPFQTIQSETAKELVEKPNMTAAQKAGLFGRKAVKTGLGGLETLGVGQSLVGDIAITPSSREIAIKLPNIGKLQGGKITLRPAWKAGEVKTGLIPQFISNLRERIKLQNAQKLLEPKLTTKEKIEALQRAGQPGGAVIRRGRVTIEPTEEMRDVINTVKDLNLKPNRLATTNIKKINKVISDVSEKKILPLLQENNIPLTDDMKEVLMNQIQTLKPTLATTPEQNALTERIKNLVIDKIIDSDTNLDLYLNRIDLDDIIRRELGSKYLSPENVGLANNIIRQARQILNNAIAQNTSKPEVFRNLLNYEHNLFIARQILAKKGVSEIGKKEMQLFLQRHPALPKLAKIGGAAAAAWYGLKKINRFLRNKPIGGGFSQYNY